MATSTTNLLQAVNRVLTDVGERGVTSINSSNPAGRKALTAVQDALRFVSTAHDWEWLHNTVSAPLWVGDTFTVTNAQQIRGVAWRPVSTQGSWDLQYVDVRQYDLQYPETFVYSAGIASRPRYYCLPSYQTVRVNPYPTNALGQASVYVYIIEDVTIPSTDTSFLPVPEKYMQLIIMKACYFMSIKHLEDSNSAQYLDKDFNELLMRYRTQENKTPTGGYNMYRNRIRRYGAGLF